MRNMLLATCFLLAQAVTAQKAFQGTVKFQWKLSGESIEMMEAMMPESLTIRFSKAGSRVTFNGGMMSAMLGEFMYSAKSKKSYMIKDDEKVAYEMSDDAPADQAPATYEKEDEIITIMGYSCQKYKMTSVSDGVETVSYIWVTDQIKPYHSDQGSSIGLNGVKSEIGFPMKIVSSADGVTVTMTVTEIDNTAPNKALFSVPKDYSVEQYSEM